MLNRVFDQVGNHLSEQLLITREIEIRFDAAQKLLARVLRHWEVNFDNAFEKGRRPNWLETRAAAAGFNLRNPEQSGEGRKDTLRFAYRSIDDSPRLGRAAGDRSARFLKALEKFRQGGAQVVSHVGRDLLEA